MTKDFIEVQQVEKPIKYIRFNVGNLSRPTWVHIASGKPFQCMPGRFGRWSTTVCGKEYEMDDYSVVKGKTEQSKYLCKKCAKIKGISHDRRDTTI
jgi:hypothetical protein